MRMKWATLLLGTVGIWGGLAQAEHAFEFSPYPTPAGAPVAEVNGIVEAVDGAIWVVTWGEGAHRIHGTQWRTFTEADGLPDDWIRSICPSRSGGVWVGTGDGLARIRENEVQALTQSNLPLLSSPDIFFVGELSDGQVWISTRGGWILVRDPEEADPDDISKGWRILAGPEETGGRTIYQMVESAPGEVLLSIPGEGLAWVRDGQWVQDELAGGDDWFVLYSEVVGGEQVLYAITQDGSVAYRRDDAVWKNEGPALSGVREMAADESGISFAATVRGLYEKTEEGWKPREFPVAMGAPFLQHVLIASDGAMWLGGKEGLYRGAERPWSIAPLAEGIKTILPRVRSGDPVLGMDEKGQIFESDSGQWISKFSLLPWDGKGWHPDDSIWMGDGGLWKRTETDFEWLKVDGSHLYRVNEHHFRVYDATDGTVIRESSLPPCAGHIGRYFLTSDERLWCLTEERVYQLDGETWRPVPDLDGYLPQQISAVKETEPGVFWVGMIRGIERWSDGKVAHFGKAQGIDEGDTIHSICQTRSGELWFGSMGSGIYHYDGETFRHFTTTSGLYRNTVRNIYEAADGGIWLAYRGTGISSFQNDHWVHYGFEHGLPNASILGFAETAPGALWVFASDQQLYRYLPDRLAPETEIAVGPRALDVNEPGVFSFDARDAWNQTQSRDLYYSWRIVPQRADTDLLQAWSSFSRRNTVASEPLPPGTYTFEVRSSDENGNVDPTPATLGFVVAPPLWLKPVFYVPVALSLVLALIAVTFRYRSHRALMRSEAALRAEVAVRIEAESQLAHHRDNLEVLVEERTGQLAKTQEELLQKERLAILGQITATVSHELRNPLGTIQSSLFLVERKVRGKGLDLERTLERATRSIRRCDHIVEEMLDFTRLRAGDTQLHVLDSWLKDELLEIDVPRSVALDLSLESNASVNIDPESMRRVFINLLDNAVQALEGDGGPEKRIHVLTTTQDERAVICVEDTGPGLTEEVLEHIFEPLFSTKNFGVGLGTNIVKNIMERHEGGIEYGNVPDGGARVTLWLPTHNP